MIGICDDLEEERLALSRMVRSYAQERGMPVRLRLFSSGTELLEASPRQRDFQILFLDIFMPGLSGMDAARQLRRDGVNAAIIFATTSLDHGLDSFEVQAADYLVKPFQKQDVAQALDWCLAHLPEPLRCLSVYSEGETQEIPLASIPGLDLLYRGPGAPVPHLYHASRDHCPARAGLTGGRHQQPGLSPVSPELFGQHEPHSENRRQRFPDDNRRACAYQHLQSGADPERLY